jgi:hypothetical protein
MDVLRPLRVVKIVSRFKNMAVHGIMPHGTTLN